MAIVVTDRRYTAFHIPGMGGSTVYILQKYYQPGVSCTNVGRELFLLLINSEEAQLQSRLVSFCSIWYSIWYL